MKSADYIWATIIGLRSNMGSPWKWDDGTPLDYTNWYKSNSTNNGNDCVIMYTSYEGENNTSIYTWEPIFCKDAYNEITGICAYTGKIQLMLSKGDQNPRF